MAYNLTHQEVAIWNWNGFNCGYQNNQAVVPSYSGSVSDLYWYRYIYSFC